MFPSSHEVLEQLDAVLDSLASVAVENAEAFAVQLQRRAARLDALVTSAVGAVDRAGLSGNARSTAAWFAHATHRPVARAKAMVANARALRSMPLVADAFAAGEVSGEHVRVLAGAPLLEKAEEELLDSARSDRFDVFKRNVAYWRQIAEPDLVEDEAEKIYDSRSFDASRSFEDHVYLDGILDPVGGSIFRTELDRLERLLWEDDQQNGSSRTNTQRRADALVLMAERSAAMPEGAKRARVLINVLVGYETFAGRICQLADGTILTPGQVVSLLDDADVQRVVFESASQVLDVGRRQRLFTGATRTAVNLANLECQGDPSCDVPFERCEVDHIQPFEHWGETTQDNGRPLCTWHHRKRQRRT
ncbi:MAG TPA: DUF222 domain-containing protein [Acidimicrobiales bacterium]|nr:DUF222 domain-containing protein [Acidimicrobiales bacterium]